jgi:hypothetical protein
MMLKTKSITVLCNAIAMSNINYSQESMFHSVKTLLMVETLSIIVARIDFMKI